MEYHFSPASVLNGSVGQIALTIQDEDNICAKDTVDLPLASGECNAFKNMVVKIV